MSGKEFIVLCKLSLKLTESLFFTVLSGDEEVRKEEYVMFLLSA